MLLPAAMATVDVHVKMVDSRQPGLLSDRLRNERVVSELSGVESSSSTATVPLWSPFSRGRNGG